jgi:Ice-binding-like
MYASAHKFLRFLPGYVRKRTEPLATLRDSAITTLGATPSVPCAGIRGRNESAANGPLSAFHDEEEQMNKLGNFFKPLTWFTALVLAALVAGCGGDEGTGSVPALPGSAAGAVCTGANCVNLLTAGNFVILTSAGITNTGGHTTAITGDIGSSPITGAAMDNVFCSEITGTIYGVDAAYTGSGDASCYAGSPADKTTVDNAVADMLTAYNAAVAMTPTGTDPTCAAPIGPGVYNFSVANITLVADCTLAGSATDVWVFKITGNLQQDAGFSVLLTGGALPQNVFWQVGGGVGVNILAGAHMEGVILAAAGINLVTGATLNGRLYSQTAVALDANAITVP